MAAFCHLERFNHHRWGGGVGWLLCLELGCSPPLLSPRYTRFFLWLSFNIRYFLMFYITWMGCHICGISLAKVVFLLLFLFTMLRAVRNCSLCWNLELTVLSVIDHVASHVCHLDGMTLYMLLYSIAFFILRPKILPLAQGPLGNVRVLYLLAVLLFCFCGTDILKWRRTWPVY